MLITSEIVNKIARKVLFTCVRYTKNDSSRSRIVKTPSIYIIQRFITERNISLIWTDKIYYLRGETKFTQMTWPRLTCFTRYLRQNHKRSIIEWSNYFILRSFEHARFSFHFHSSKAFHALLIRLGLFQSCTLS